MCQPDCIFRADHNTCTAVITLSRIHNNRMLSLFRWWKQNIALAYIRTPVTSNTFSGLFQLIWNPVWTAAKDRTDAQTDFRNIQKRWYYKSRWSDETASGRFPPVCPVLFIILNIKIYWLFFFTLLYFFWSNCCPAVCKAAGCPQERNYPWTLSEKYIAGLSRKLFTLQFPFYLTENPKSQEA